MTNKSTKRAIVSSVMALFLCFAMLLGTTYAWFTDSVKSENNIIQTGKLKIGLVWADGATDPANTTWNEASVKIFNYDKWEPGYAAARHFKVTNNGTLAFNYKMRIVADGIVTKLADVIDVYYVEEDAAVERADIANAEYLGTLAEVLGTEKSLSNTICGSLVAGADAHIHTVVFKMKEEADDKYQDMDLGCTFTIELIATQMASEKDSFGPDYDAIVSVPETPEALVRPIDPENDFNFTRDDGEEVTIAQKGLKIKYTKGIGGEVCEGILNTAYQFEPTMSLEEALQSECKLWHADFVVYADHDVPADSMMLAGYYDAWCELNNDNWVGLTAGETISAGTKVRLVSNLGATVNWKELCEYGNDGLGFLCGAADLTGQNAGTTLTVELLLYKVGAQGECATGGGCTHPSVDCEISEEDPILAGKFTYTFDAVPVKDQAELNEAVANGIPAVSLGAGTYTMPDVAAGTTLTVVGNGNTTVSVVDEGASEGDIDYSLRGANVTFENVTLNIAGSDHPGYAGLSATYNNCTIIGSNYCLYGDSVFNNCTFKLNNGYVWTWGAANVEFNNCTFEAPDGSAKAILVHNTVETTVIVKDCTFIATTTKTTWDGIPVAAVSIDPEVGSPDATVYFVGTNTYSDAFNGLYQVKYADELDDVAVYVNDQLIENVPVGENDK